VPDGAVPGDTKLCKECGYVLDVACFGLKYPERGIRQHLCRVCSRAASRMYYLRNPAPYKARAKAGRKQTRARIRLKLHEFLSSTQCLDCGIRDLAVLEFDHRDPLQKEVEIAELIRHVWSWARILAEITKCDVVCANCHRKRTARYFGWRKLLGLEELTLPALPKRGTPDYERIKGTRSRLARRHRNRMYLYNYLREHPCGLCGEADPVVLDFDHLRDKRREVTILAILSGRANLVAEIAKCRVLCANCHRRQTAERAGRQR
jgi:5-methylcytosine-specific restriction endonuclease McrA